MFATFRLEWVTAT